MIEGKMYLSITEDGNIAYRTKDMQKEEVIDIKGEQN